MSLTIFDQIALILLGLCLSIVAAAAVRGVILLSEQARFERYERLREILNEVCRPDGLHATKLLAVHELRHYREYSAVVAQAMRSRLPRPQMSAPASAAARGDILEGVVIRRRGEPVKGSVLREALRLRDSVIYR